MLGDERVGLRPVAARLDVDDVDVAVEQQRAAAAAAAEARDELRAAVERRARRAPSGAGAARRHRARAASTSAPWRAQQRGEVLLQRALLARRGAGRVRDGVEGRRARCVSATRASRRAATASATRRSSGESCMTRYRSPRERQLRRASLWAMRSLGTKSPPWAKQSASHAVTRSDTNDKPRIVARHPPRIRSNAVSRRTGMRPILSLYAIPQAAIEELHGRRGR